MLTVKPKKSLGQHFLFDKNICSAIVSSSITIRDRIVVEVGPGLGSLTNAILEKNPKHLFLIEKDSDLVVNLHKLYCANNNITIIEEDALKIDISTISDEKIIIISNLPYNIGTELLCNWLCNSSSTIDHLTLMMQKEVVERICAKSKDKNYGRLSIICQYLAEVEKSFDVDRKLFTPPPKVTSSILQVKPFAKDIDQKYLRLIQNILTEAFSLRRKMIKTSLRKFLSPNDFIELNIPSTQRAEELKIDDFIKIANFIKIRNII